MLKTARLKTTIPTLTVFWLLLSTLLPSALLLSALLLSHPCHAGKKGKHSSVDKSPKTEIREDAETPEDNISWEKFNNWMQYSERCSKLRDKVGESEHGFTMREVCFPEEEPPSCFRSTTLHLLINDLVHLLQIRLEELGFETAPKLCGYYGVQLPGRSPEESTKQVIEYIEVQDPLLLPALTHLIYLARHESSPLNEKERAYLELRLQYINEAIVPPGMNKFDWNKKALELLDCYKTWNRSEISFPQAETEKALKLQIEIMEKEYIDDQDNIFVLKHLSNNEYEPTLKMMTVWNAALVLYKSSMVLKSARDPLRNAHVYFTIQAALAGSYLSPAKQMLTACWLALSDISSDPRINHKDQWTQQILDYYPSGTSKLQRSSPSTPSVEEGKKPFKKAIVPKAKKKPAGRSSFHRKLQVPSNSKKNKVNCKTTVNNNAPSPVDNNPSTSNTKGTRGLNRTEISSSTASTRLVTTQTPPPKKVTPAPFSSLSPVQPATKAKLKEATLDFGFTDPTSQMHFKHPKKPISFKPTRNRPGSLGLKTHKEPQFTSLRNKTSGKQSVAEYDKEQEYAQCPLTGPALRLPTYHK